MKVYLENSTLGLLYEYENDDISGALSDKENNLNALIQILGLKFVQFFTSADACSELERTCQSNPNRKDKLLKTFDKFKFINLGHRARFGDRYRFGDHINFGPKYPKIQEKISEFLQKESKSDTKEHYYDSMHLSNCYKTDIDYFLTIDSRTILEYKDKIKEIFGIKVVTPVELLNIINK